MFIRYDNLDAVIAPSRSLASSPAAVAGYPNLSLPIGLDSDGAPSAIWMYGGALSEARLLSFAYDLEQEISPRLQPQFLGDVPPDPRDGGFCAAPVVAGLRGNPADRDFRRSLR